VIGSNIGNSSVPECNLEKDIKVPVLEIEIPVPEIEVRPLETKTYSCHDRVITLKKMLSEDFKTCETKNKIRYFHIPYNNMQVSRLNLSLRGLKVLADAYQSG